MTTVVFDGYELSTEEKTRATQLNKVSKVVEVSAKNRCPSDTQEFPSDITIKRSFIHFWVNC